MRLSAILPQGVSYSEQVGTLQGALLAEEAALLGAAAVEKRRVEFAAGRSCARAALAMLGVLPTAVLQGERREPLWPPGIVGSITHCAHYCAAVVASMEDYAGIGIDAEINQPLPPGVLELVARKREREWIAARTQQRRIHWDRLLFSLKESVFKIWYPLERCWLGFEEAEIEIDDSAGLFRATVLRSRSRCPPVIYGRFHTFDLHLLSCASIPAGSLQAP